MKAFLLIVGFCFLLISIVLYLIYVSTKRKSFFTSLDYDNE